MPNALTRPGPQLVFAVAGALVFVGSLFFFVARYAWGMDGVPTGPAVPAVLFNVVLFSVFALHHSILARSGAKAVVMRTWPPALERSLYVWISSLLFISVCGLWQPVAGLWWSEGLTLFYADLLLRRAALPTNDSTRVAHLESLIGRYLSAPGNARYYQCQYRNPSAGFCPPEGFNISNGCRIAW